MKPNIIYDYAIVGCGVAGLHLAYQFSKSQFFSTKKIVLIDKNFNPLANRALSYWEKGEGEWDSIVKKAWNKTVFESNTIKLNLDLTPYTYKTVDFKDFSIFCKNELQKNQNFEFVEDGFIDFEEEEEDEVVIKLLNSEIKTRHVFDSTMSKQYALEKEKYPSVIQSFKGFQVEFETTVFDASMFTMMDYRLQWKTSNSFMYILPSTTKSALFEYTFFAPFTISDKELEVKIKEYIDTFYSQKNYKIIGVEAGEIPMTSYPFVEDSRNRVKKIGTAGGWVKASTGYSFKFAEKNAKIIAHQIERGEVVTGYKQPKRFRFYDSLFIKVLQNQNSKGPKIFEEMYKKVKPSVLFRFLDEETTLLEEIMVILKLPYWPFIKSLFS